MSVSCLDVVCPEGEECAAGQCYPKNCGEQDCDSYDAVCYEEQCTHRSCVEVECPSDEVCARGACYPDDCGGVDCEAGEVCAAGECVDSDCMGVRCDAGRRCVEGWCLDADCPDADCAPVEVCIQDRCIPQQCFAVRCQQAERCASDGQCHPADCSEAVCDEDEVCIEEVCTDWNCVGVECPPGRICDGGVCVLGCPPFACTGQNQCETYACGEVIMVCLFGRESGEPGWEESDSGGSCTDSDPCTHDDACQQGVCIGTEVQCDSPPPDRCEGDTRVSFAAFGACQDGSCEYEEIREDCPEGCEAGICLGCDAERCPDGCCREARCLASALTSCGIGGAPCIDCSSVYGARADACSPLGACVCEAAGALCRDGEACTQSGCCPEDRLCAGICCGTEEACLSGACCPLERLCDQACCEEGQVCVSGICCTPHSFQACHEDDLTWFDSCGNPEETASDCGVDGCDGWGAWSCIDAARRRRSRICHDRGCDQSACFDVQTDEDQTESCGSGNTCVSGNCEQTVVVLVCEHIEGSSASSRCGTRSCVSIGLDSAGTDGLYCCCSGFDCPCNAIYQQSGGTCSTNLCDCPPNSNSYTNVRCSY
ncbi:MAG: hypothetical protein JXR96_19170 [Deltaproteobacteria bacterium]|nr:hypothetical protein [Deltaproteobacteria bacterium]